MRIRILLRGAARLMAMGLAFSAGAVGGSPAPALAQAPAAAPPDCSSVEGLNFVCGLGGVEDIVAAPGRRWLIGSSRRRSGAGLYVIDAKTRTAKPADLSVADGAGAAPFAGCAPPDLKALNTHGLELRPGKDGVHTIYVVNHQGRESIEVFSMDTRGPEPVIRWIGCLIPPPDVSGNGVAALPDGGLAITKFQPLGDPLGYDHLMQGQITGTVYLWEPGKGFSEAAGARLAGDNGIVVSPDGKWLFVAEYGARKVRRISIDGSAPTKTVATAYNPDNLRWDTNGRIMVGGQFVELANRNGPHGWGVDSLDPRTMTLKPVMRKPATTAFDNATTAIRAEGQLWIGSYRGDRIAYVPAP